MSDIVLFGDSFITYFAEFLETEDKYNNLGLDESKFKIRCIGLRGLSLSRRRQLYSREKELSCANFISVSLGSNDLCKKEYHPAKFAKDLISFAQYLKYGYGVQKVVIGQILFREKVNYADYNSHVTEANNELFNLCQTQINQGIYFWRHRGIWNLDYSILDRDVVHLSAYLGYPKYLRILRDCIIRMSAWP